MAGNKLGKDGVGYVWSRVFNLIKLITGDVEVSEKGNLQEQVDTLSETVQDCFTSVSNGKQLVANAITDKGVTTAIDAEFATMATNIAQIKTQGTMQAKTASLSTSAQTIKPDTGYDGLSQVVVPAVNGTAGTGDVVASKTFSSASGINQTGTLADKTGTTDHQATASLDTTNNRLKFKIPALGKYGTSNYLYAAYSTIASLIGLTAAKLVKGNTILGIAGNSNNMDTSGANAAAGHILSGKKAGVKGSLITGTMKNNAGTTVATSGITQDDTYTYAGIPETAYYDTNSKVRIPNSDLVNVLRIKINHSYNTDNSIYQYVQYEIKNLKTDEILLSGSLSETSWLNNASFSCDLNSHTNITIKRTPDSSNQVIQKIECIVKDTASNTTILYINKTTNWKSVDEYIDACFI